MARQPLPLPPAPGKNTRASGHCHTNTERLTQHSCPIIHPSSHRRDRKVTPHAKPVSCLVVTAAPRTAVSCSNRAGHRFSQHLWKAGPPTHARRRKHRPSKDDEFTRDVLKKIFTKYYFYGSSKLLHSITGNGRERGIYCGPSRSNTK